MMKIKDMFRITFAKIRKNPANIIVLSLICGLIVSAVFYLQLLFNEMFLLVLLVVIPFFFATIFSFRNLKYVNEISFKRLMSSYFLYFAIPFRSSFKLIMSFLKTSLFNFLITIIVGVSLYFAFDAIDPLFSDSIVSYITATSEAEQEVALAQCSLIHDFLYYMYVPESLIFNLIFFMYISFESTSVYLRADKLKFHPNVSRFAFSNAIKENRKEYCKYFFGLNWPMFVLMVIGAVVGVFISQQIFGFDPFASSALGSCGMFLGATIYSPIFFTNQETIYEAFLPHFQQGFHDFINLMKKQAEEFSKQFNLYKDNEVFENQAENNNDEVDNNKDNIDIEK